VGRNSDTLRAGPSEDRILLGARISAPVQTDTGAHPAFYAVGTGSFPGVKRSGRGVDHPQQSSAEGIERIELYIYSASRPLWPVLGCSRVQYIFRVFHLFIFHLFLHPFFPTFFLSIYIFISFLFFLFTVLSHVIVHLLWNVLYITLMCVMCTAPSTLLDSMIIFL